MKKKIIAMALALVTLVSSMGALSAAFAAESTELDAIKQQIESTTNLTDADGKALALRFKLLTDDEKDSLGVDAVQKMYTLAYEAAPGSNNVKTDVEKKIQFQKEMLGEYTKEMQSGYKLRRILYANNQFRASYDFITVDVDGTKVEGVIDQAFDYVNDTTNANANWQVLYTAKAQNKILNETIKIYKASSEIAREYADIFQHLNVQGQLVDGVVIGYQSYGRNSFLREIIKQFNNTMMPKSHDEFFSDAKVDPKAPAKPTVPKYPDGFENEKDTAYDAFMGNSVNVAWQQLLVFIGNPWFESAITPEMLAAAGCTTLDDAKAKAPAKKVEIDNAEKAHKDWISKSETTKKYEQALKDYEPKKKLYDKTFSDYERYKSEERVKYLKSMDCFTKSEVKAFEAAFKITDVYNEFFADQTNKEKEQTAIDAYQKYYVDGLSPFEKNVLSSNSMAPFLYIGGQTKSLSDAMTTVRKIRDVSAYNEFRKWIDEHKIPTVKSFEYNKTITEAKNRLKSIDRNLTRNFENEYPQTYKKYQEILKMWRYVNPTDRVGATHQDAFVGETVALKGDRNLSYLVELLLPNANGLLSVARGSIAGNPTAEKSQYKGIFTNDNVTFLVKTVYQLLGGIEAMGMSLSIPPSGNGSVSESIIDKYPAAGADLAKAETWDDVVNVDWGIKEDNYDEFANAFITALEPVLALLSVVQVSFPNSSTYAQYDSNTATKDFKYGAYEQVIIPILETMGVKNIMTSDAFTAASIADGLVPQMKMIVDQFKPIIQELLANPVQYLASILPNLMYHLQDGCALKGVGGLLSGVGVSLDLGWDVIVGMLDDALASTGLTVADLQLEKLEKLAKLGKATEVKSSRANTETVRFIESDTVSVYNHLANVIDDVAVKLGIDLGNNSELVKVEAPSYPHNGKMTKDVVLALVDGLDALVSDMLDINALINDNLCTNAMASQIIEGLYGSLGDLNMNILKLNINVTPDALAKALGNDKRFKDLVGELNGLTSWKDVALYLTNDDGEVVHETSMGFKDGDRDGFFDTLVAALRPLVKVLADANVLTNTARADGTTAYGLYDLVIVPVLEDLGLVPNSSETYSKNFNQLMKKAKSSEGKVDADKAGEAYDYLITTIINPVVKILDSIGSTPVKTLMSILPNAAYQAEHGKIFGLISNIPGLSKDGNLDIAGLVNSLLADADIAIELPQLNLDMVASNGQTTEKKSVSSIRENYTVVKADVADMFVQTWYYLYDTVNYKDNLENIKTMLAGIEGIDSALQTVIDSLLNSVFTSGKEESLCSMAAMFAPDAWVCPNAEVENAENGTNGNNGKTPGTGDMAISSIVVVSVLFTAGVAIVIFRKKKSIAE